MKKVRLKAVALFLVALICVGMLVSCNGNENNVSDGKTKITLWAWGDEAEISAFTKLFNDYNANNTDGIYVNFVKKASASYYTTLETELGGRQPPDLFYVGDSMVKRYAEDYLEDISPYIAKSDKINLSDIWGTLMQRYKFDTSTYRYSESASIWGLPKDIGPTVVYYNEDAFKAKGITIISASDDDGDGKVTYNGKDYPARGYDPVNKVFNNQIAVKWNESGQSDFDKLNDLLTNGSTVKSEHKTRWSFYSSWWFCFGWSVGGDCIQYNESEGCYEFTLNDEKPNYRVLNDIEINGHSYTAGSFVDYYDLEYMQTNASATQKLIDDGTLVQLPSIRSAFDYWLSLFHDGHSPKPENISNELALFTNEETAMFVQGRYNVVDFRKNCSFDWDVAPLPKHEDGVEAGHSGSMCLAMAKRSKNKALAFKVMEYACGVEGQNALAETGFNVPNQISTATDPTKAFLSSTQRPYNNSVFLRAAEYQKGGDWTYLADDAWITIWSPTLNGDVLNEVKTVDYLFSTYKDKVNAQLRTYTK